ncbi:uncharacterized protein LOC135840958 [Planococcus citri]|uniref:uncharacterized protein LOC135840958 n=1 Tax=Planococcus citri TaxID=170843 RepID=UPI0031F91F17
MRISIVVVFFIMMTIFDLPGAFAPEGESGEDGEVQNGTFDLEKGKNVLITLLDYINNLGALTAGLSYDSIKSGINNASDLDSLKTAGKNILYHITTAKNLVRKGKANLDVATAMKKTFKAYIDGFWALLDNAGLDGSDIPLGTELREIILELDETWLGEGAYGTDGIYTPNDWWISR